jgi:hypothetical protein
MSKEPNSIRKGGAWDPREKVDQARKIGSAKLRKWNRERSLAFRYKEKK